MKKVLSEIKITDKSAYGSTDVGQQRERNEDCYLVLPGKGIYIVADGMGGHNAGEVASLNAIKYIGKYYSYNLHQLCSKDRSKKLTFARQVAMFLMKKITDKPLRDIGYFLGGRDHSTVMHALDKVAQHAQNNDDFQNQLRKMEEDILS